LFGILTFGTTISSYAEGDWKIYLTNATVSELVPEVGKWSFNVNEVFKIPYKITNGTLETIKLDSQAQTIKINIKNVTNHGMLEIAIPTDLVNAKIGVMNDKFFVLINGKESNYKESTSPPCFRTLVIEFESNSKEIEIIGTGIPEKPLNSYMPAVYITMNKTNINSKVIAFSGCTDLKLDDKQVLLNITNTQTQNHKNISVAPDINGSFFTSVPVGDLGENGIYIVNATYAGYSKTNTVAVPEFPYSLLILVAGIIGMLTIRRKWQKLVLY